MLMKNKKIGLIIILTISILSTLSSNAISSTTLEDSSVGVEEGEVYSWQYNYVDFWLHPFVYARTGDTVKITIEKIYRGAYQSINHALLMNVTIEENISSQGITTSNRPVNVVYNKSLHFIRIEQYPHNIPFPMIIPIPLNLTLIAGYYESIGETCTIEGNTLIFETSGQPAGNTDEFTFNSDGILTEYVFISNDNLIMRMVLIGPSGGGVPLPLIIIAAVSIVGGIGVAGVSIILLRKRKRAREGI